MEPLIIRVNPASTGQWTTIFIAEDLNIRYELQAIQTLPGLPPKSINDESTIEDPNTAVRISGTGALSQYLVRQYDKERKLSYESMAEDALCNQWLFFQCCHHETAMEQSEWFQMRHHEQLPSAISKYKNLVATVLSTLEGVLASKPQSEQFLVGNRITFADLAFVAWNHRLDVGLGVARDEMFQRLPHVAEWHRRMTARPSWTRTMQIRTRILEEQNARKGETSEEIETLHEKDLSAARGLEAAERAMAAAAAAAAGYPDQ